jgi:hypothetical protein
VQKLHLVGFTTDHDGLILSARKSARSGGYLLNVDDTLAEAVDAYRARQEELGATKNGRADREESRLGISEIQARLRRGKSVKDIAKDAGVSPEWIERFAAPVFAEKAQVIDYVRNAALRRPRLGASSLRVGDAIRHNLAERGVALSGAEFAEGWTTHQLPNGRWTVRFKVRYRGADKTLRYDLRGVGQEITAYDQLTRQLSYVAPPARKAAPRPAAAAPAGDDEKKRAQVSTGFRPEPAKGKATSRSAKERERAAKAMTQAAAKRSVESEKAAARKARERAQALARREREAKAEALRREKEAAARAKEAAAAARAAAVAAARREREDAAAAEARRVAREEAREAARAKAIKAVRSRPAAKKATQPAAKRAAKPADKARTAAAVRKRGAAAEEATRTRTSKARTPSAATVAKRAAASPAKAATKAPARTATPVAKAAKSTPAKSTPAKSTPVKVAPATRKASSNGRPREADRVAEPPPTAAARVDPARLCGATDSYGPEGARALFRAGLVEPASGDDVTAETARPEIRTDRPAPSGVRFMGRRRRRQLRAD